MSIAQQFSQHHVQLLSDHFIYQRPSLADLFVLDCTGLHDLSGEQIEEGDFIQAQRLDGIYVIGNVIEWDDNYIKLDDNGRITFCWRDDHDVVLIAKTDEEFYDEYNSWLDSIQETAVA